MDWYNHITMGQIAKSLGLIDHPDQINQIDPKIFPVGDQYRLLNENLWVQNNRPFYNLWPSVTLGFSKVSLDFPMPVLMPLLENLPFPLSIRLAKGYEIQVGQSEMLSMFYGRCVCLSKEGWARGIGLWVNLRDGSTNQLLLRIDKHSIEEELHSSEFQRNLSKDDEQTTLIAARILTCLALIKDDSEMLDRVVLTSDQAEYAVSRDSRLEDKAKNRGVNGWNVGARLVVSPHYRHPHFAIRWTGKGRVTPILTAIKGSVVRRSKMTEVPTGYLGIES